MHVYSVPTYYISTRMNDTEDLNKLYLYTLCVNTNEQGFLSKQKFEGKNNITQKC